jgi:hypothetical protein
VASCRRLYCKTATQQILSVVCLLTEQRKLIFVSTPLLDEIEDSLECFDPLQEVVFGLKWS